MNLFDRNILLFFNQFAQRSEAFDRFNVLLQDAPLFKGGILCAMLWGIWFYQSPTQGRNREVVLATLAGAVLSVVVGRLLALGLPMRVRPLQDPELAFVRPIGLPSEILRGWSAFPSDHAMVFSCMAAGLWFVSRRLSLALCLYVLVVVAVPRVYLGLHHPTDIIAGALIGVLVAWLVNRDRIRVAIARYPLGFSEQYPALFFAAMFLFTYQLATLFDEARQFGSFFWHLYRHSFA